MVNFETTVATRNEQVYILLDAPDSPCAYSPCEQMGSKVESATDMSCMHVTNTSSCYLCT